MATHHVSVWLVSGKRNVCQICNEDSSLAQYGLNMSVGADDTPSVTADLVSCLCVTRNRVPMLRRAVNCFLDQTYEPRELIVVHRSDDSATRNYLDGLQQALIRTVELPVRPKISLGELRNIAIQASRGRYIATWDDDDWHSPLRLAGQIELMRASGKSACLMMRLVLFDQLTQQSYLSGQRLWEGSLVAERHVLGRYPDLARGSDSVVVDQLIAKHHTIGLDSPHLYVYVVHDANTWSRDHFMENMLPFAQRLTPESADKVRVLLEQHL